MRRQEDPYFIPGADDDPLSEVGGSDGDVSGPAQFATSVGQPWLRNPLPPWHLWGGTERVIVAPTAPLVQIPVNTTTLVRVSYKRPETWRFLFHAVIDAGGSATVGAESAIVDIDYDLIIGIGRSAITIPAFLSMQFDWTGGSQPLRGQPLFMTTTRGISSIPFIVGPLDPTPIIDQFVAQDITIAAHVDYLTDVVAAAPISIAISAQVAPQAHVRPDWYQPRAPHEVAFAGAETEGR